MALEDPRATSPPEEAPTPHRDNDPARLIGDERLPCGRLVSHVWEQARAGRDQPDAHTAGCTYCQQASEGLTALDAITRSLRAERPSARTVADRVVRAVRAEARLGRMVPLDDPAQELRIAENTVAKILRRAADRIPGVRAASCRLTPDDAATTVTITMTLAATLDQPLPSRAAQVRQAVADASAQEIGLAVSSIDLSIVSELEPLLLAEPTPRNGTGP
ncbi:hypothetical protein [Streptomyces sp. NEAU-S7GS2]|uniref:hypothetical protein n=1 Tax=Streptomyces sp. NEAU-S7GS2 TaxID=2202000 RepID=UPI000D6ED710|nr:hypothetical protein [Streptomyces sp. NEAU-S7GS2]AWN30642.1 hypothetical protein DKG71_35170 [Streptomyces sp. NEAU-S7GS2]